MNDNYLPHDYHTRQDDKVDRLVFEMGMEGYGIFWSLIELLYQNKGKMPLECERIASALRTQCDKVMRVIYDFNLFANDKKFFWSESAFKRIKEIKNKSEKARKSAMTRWNKSGHSDANALPTQCQRNAIKENKNKIKYIIKEENIKEEKSVILSQPSESPEKDKKPEKKFFTFKDIEEHDIEEIADKYKVPIAFVRSKYDDMCNYCEAKGKKYQNYKAALSNWVKRDAMERMENAQSQSSIVFADSPEMAT